VPSPGRPSVCCCCWPRQARDGRPATIAQPTSTHLALPTPLSTPTPLQHHSIRQTHVADDGPGRRVGCHLGPLGPRQPGRAPPGPGWRQQQPAVACPAGRSGASPSKLALVAGLRIHPARPGPGARRAGADRQCSILCHSPSSSRPTLRCRPRPASSCSTCPRPTTTGSPSPPTRTTGCKRRQVGRTTLMRTPSSSDTTALALARPRAT